MTSDTDHSPQTAPAGRIQGTPLAGQHALITGATRGIGAAIAETLGALGANLTLIGRDREMLDERAGTIAGTSGVNVHAETADVSDASAIDHAFESAAAAIKGRCSLH